MSFIHAKCGQGLTYIISHAAGPDGRRLQIPPRHWRVSTAVVSVNNASLIWIRFHESVSEFLIFKLKLPQETHLHITFS